MELSPGSRAVWLKLLHDHRCSYILTKLQGEGSCLHPKHTMAFFASKEGKSKEGY